MEAIVYPAWLVALAWTSLALAVLCSAIIVIDIARDHRQHMWIMNVVWPITALYGSAFALWAYFRAGRLSTRNAVEEAKRQGKTPPGKEKPFWQITALGASHCGSGCTVGDIAAEWLIVAFPFAVLGQKIFGAWLLDYILAFLFGVAFQYFTIVPMKNLPKGKGVWAAVKADALSLTAWQVGMYGWMAIAVFVIFRHEIPKTNPVFWFMMQIAMWFGLMTSFPVNWWLIKKGIKERM
ncbi:DUF4396 domain-containing protein [Geomonas oryzisoli]|nr:DUF4396 domain-containing protein [Geomonas oryzisoli]